MSILLLQGRISQVVLLKLKVKNSLTGRDPLKMLCFRLGGSIRERSILINRESGTGKQMFIRYLLFMQSGKTCFSDKLLALKVI